MRIVDEMSGVDSDTLDELFFLRTMVEAGFGITYHGDMVFSLSVPKTPPEIINRHDRFEKGTFYI